MELREISYGENLDATLEVMGEHGLLLTSVAKNGRPNVMTFGWGCVGVVWSKPTFTVFVRPSRLTCQNLEETGEFVVNVPTAAMHDLCLRCGSVSGRTEDKFAAKGLTVVKAEMVRAPLIGQCVRFYECKVVHYADVISPTGGPGALALSPPEGDHRVYYGEIVRAAERA